MRSQRQWEGAGRKKGVSVLFFVLTLLHVSNARASTCTHSFLGGEPSTRNGYECMLELESGSKNQLRLHYSFERAGHLSVLCELLPAHTLPSASNASVACGVDLQKRYASQACLTDTLVFLLSESLFCEFQSLNFLLREKEKVVSSSYICFVFSLLAKTLLSENKCARTSCLNVATSLCCPTIVPNISPFLYLCSLVVYPCSIHEQISEECA